MERRPLVIDNGRLRELPAGDTVAGVTGVTTWKEPVSVENSGDPQLLFAGNGDIIMAEAS